MLQTLNLFDGPILTMEEFYALVDEFSEQTAFYYRAVDAERQDLFPMLPLAAETYFTHNVAYIIGLVQGNRPGKCLLQGVVKIGGFKDIVHSAYEPIMGVPASVSVAERETVVRALRRRLSRSVLLLADAAGMHKYAPFTEVEHVRND